MRHHMHNERFNRLVTRAAKIAPPFMNGADDFDGAGGDAWIEELDGDFPDAPPVLEVAGGCRASRISLQPVIQGARLRCPREPSVLLVPGLWVDGGGKPPLVPSNVPRMLRLAMKVEVVETRAVHWEEPCMCHFREA